MEHLTGALASGSSALVVFNRNPDVYASLRAPGGELGKPVRIAEGKNLAGECWQLGFGPPTAAIAKSGLAVAILPVAGEPGFLAAGVRPPGGSFGRPSRPFLWNGACTDLCSDDSYV